MLRFEFASSIQVFKVLVSLRVPVSGRQIDWSKEMNFYLFEFIKIQTSISVIRQKLAHIMGDNYLGLYVFRE